MHNLYCRCIINTVLQQCKTGNTTLAQGFSCSKKCFYSRISIKHCPQITCLYFALIYEDSTYIKILVVSKNNPRKLSFSTKLYIFNPSLHTQYLYFRQRDREIVQNSYLVLQLTNEKFPDNTNSRSTIDPKQRNDSTEKPKKHMKFDRVQHSSQYR